jgi:general secretion pathway protein L
MARWLGIDVSSLALRGAVIRTALRKLEVERYVEIPLTGPEEGPARTLELTDAVRNLLAAIGAAPDGVVTSISGKDVSLRTVELPAAARKRIGEVLPFELETLLPYDPHDAVIDHQPISEDAAGVRLLAAAVLKTKVVAELQRWNEIGLDPRELAAGAAGLDGLVGLAPAIAAGGAALLVELGDHHIDVCAIAAGRCAGARTLDVGMLDMPGAADEARRELQRTVAALRASGLPAELPAFFCGSGADGQGVQEWLSHALGRDVQPLELPAPATGRAERAPTFARALALAARPASGKRRIDLRKGDLAPTASAGSIGSQINVAIIGAVAVVVTAMFALKAQQSLLVAEEEALTEELASVTKEVLGESIEDVALVEARIKNPKSNDPLPRFDAFDALAALSTSMPGSVSHEVRRLRVEIADEKAEGRFELQGALDSLGQRDELVAALEKHPCFKDIQPGKTNVTGGDTQRISYQIEAKLHCPGEGPAEKKKSGKNDEVAP